MSNNEKDIRLLDALKSLEKLHTLGIVTGLTLIAFLIISFLELKTLYTLVGLSLHVLGWFFLFAFLYRIYFLRKQLKFHSDKEKAISAYLELLGNYRNPCTIAVLLGFAILIVGNFFSFKLYCMAIGTSVVLGFALLLVFNLISEYVLKCAIGEEPQP